MTKVAHAKWVMLDTEFIREKTYFPQVCLFQLATENTLACIDPLAITDLQPFFDWLQRPDMIKVLHAAWQDLEIFYHLNRQIPTPLFDTQIAAAILGLGDQMGYARLVESLLGVQLDKSQSRTDWSRRPLRKKQLDYAIDDVRYLRDIYPMLLKDLQQQQRMHWLDKSFQHLADPAVYEPDPRGIWKRIRGVQLLKPRQLAVLRELAAWREERAIQKNLPRRWLLADEILIDMARMPQNKVEDLQQIRNLKPEQIERHGATWLNLIQRGRELPPEEWPQLPRRRKLDEQLSLVADLMMLAVTQQAREHNIAPQLIATRSQVEKMLTEGRTRLSDDWRGSLMNELFAGLLNGRQVLRIEDMRLQIQPLD
ncbi:MAG: ribonuclease D [Thiolinea sp.]